MNDKFTNTHDELDELLTQTAQGAQPNPHFTAELEGRLRQAHDARPKYGGVHFTRKQAVSTVAWTALLVVFALALNWTIKSIAPAPTSVPASNETSTPPVRSTDTPDDVQILTTPISGGEGYNWRGTKLYIPESLPNSPAEADVYLWKADKPVILDDARALAQQFRLNGEPGETPGVFPGNFDYLVVEGTRQLQLRSDHYFTYHSTFGNLMLAKPSEEQARVVIDDFLKNHGFGFEYRLEGAPDMQGQHFYVIPLTPDGFEMRFDYMMPVQYDVTLDDTGENIILSGYSMEYESLGRFGIITVEEALQKILDPNPQTGLMESFRGQGGGGGGASFYKLNLSGTPVPFPTSSPQRVENLRGFLYINLHIKADGTQTKRYLVTGTDRNNAHFGYQLEGANLSELDAYIGLPIDVTGIIRATSDTLVIELENYNIPFPDLQFQIVRGTQKRERVNGQPGVIVFTTEDGKSYVEFGGPTNFLNNSIIGRPGDLIQQEALIIPDETFGGMPVMRVYQGGVVNDGVGNMQIQANQVIIVQEVDTPVDAYLPPTATIEKIDLVYHVRYPPYAMADPVAGVQYLQPAWRFYGRYSSGEEFEILVQALKQEFLLPELAPYTPPG